MSEEHDTRKQEESEQPESGEMMGDLDVPDAKGEQIIGGNTVPGFTPGQQLKGAVKGT